LQVKRVDLHEVLVGTRDIARTFAARNLLEFAFQLEEKGGLVRLKVWPAIDIVVGNGKKRWLSRSREG
jgi:hypothetical protein